VNTWGAACGRQHVWLVHVDGVSDVRIHGAASPPGATERIPNPCAQTSARSVATTRGSTGSLGAEYLHWHVAIGLGSDGIEEGRASGQGHPLDVGRLAQSASEHERAGTHAKLERGVQVDARRQEEGQGYVINERQQGVVKDLQKKLYFSNAMQYCQEDRKG